MAQTDGPCRRAKACAKLSGSAFRMKLTSPCLYSVTFFERCRAAATNPICSNSAASCCGSGPVYSTNSNPSVPIGLSQRSCGAGLSLIAALRKRVLPMWSPAPGLPRSRRCYAAAVPGRLQLRLPTAFAADLQPAASLLLCRRNPPPPASAGNLQAATLLVPVLPPPFLLLPQRISSKLSASIATALAERRCARRRTDRCWLYVEQIVYDVKSSMPRQCRSPWARSGHRRMPAVRHSTVMKPTRNRHEQHLRSHRGGLLQPAAPSRPHTIPNAF